MEVRRRSGSGRGVAVLAALAIVVAVACEPPVTQTDRIGAGSLQLVPEAPSNMVDQVTLLADATDVGEQVTVGWKCGQTIYPAETKTLEETFAPEFSAAWFDVPAEVLAYGVGQLRTSCTVLLTRPIDMGETVTRSLGYNDPHEWCVILIW